MPERMPDSRLFSKPLLNGPAPLGTSVRGVKADEKEVAISFFAAAPVGRILDGFERPGSQFGVGHLSVLYESGYSWL